MSRLAHNLGGWMRSIPDFPRHHGKSWKSTIFHCVLMDFQWNFMDFHDFPSFLGTSEMDLIHPSQVVCNPTISQIWRSNSYFLFPVWGNRKYNFSLFLLFPISKMAIGISEFHFLFPISRSTARKSAFYFLFPISKTAIGNRVSNPISYFLFPGFRNLSCPISYFLFPKWQ